MNDLLKDLEKLVEHHKATDGVIIRYVPICEKYEEATRCDVRLKKEGDTVKRGRSAVKVLAWVKISLNPDNKMFKTDIDWVSPYLNPQVVMK